jgi:AcrR family transcriptional regulator
MKNDYLKKLPPPLRKRLPMPFGPPDRAGRWRKIAADTQKRVDLIEYIFYYTPMGRNARFSSDQILTAALDLLAERGPQSVTMLEISRQTGAPIGSIYHRFASRDLILAQLWLGVVESFQDGFLDALAHGDGLSAALYAPRWVKEHYSEGRVLLLLRREELIAGEWPEEVKERAAALARELDDGFRAFVKQRFGSVTQETLGTAAFALIDVPYVSTRRYLEQGQKPPAIVDRLIEKTYRSIMGDEDENLERA